MPAAHPPTWLITGASSGFGKSIALEALKSGFKVIGTTRDVSRAETSFPDFSTKGGIWMGLDPAQKDAFEKFSGCAQEHDIDVLVNNAGFAFIGGIEDTRSVALLKAFSLCKKLRTDRDAQRGGSPESDGSELLWAPPHRSSMSPGNAGEGFW